MINAFLSVFLVLTVVFLIVFLVFKTDTVTFFCDDISELFDGDVVIKIKISKKRRSRYGKRNNRR